MLRTQFESLFSSSKCSSLREQGAHVCETRKQAKDLAPSMHPSAHCQATFLELFAIRGMC